jgi:hypothetical protein
MIIKHRPSHLI